MTAASEHQRRIESEIALDERTFGSGAPSVTSTNHVKSGGCWTGKKARQATWYIIANY